MREKQAAAALSAEFARAELKRRVLAAHAAGDLSGGVWLTLVRDEMARLAMSAESGET